MSDERRQALYDQLHTMSHETIDHLIERDVLR